MSEGMGRFYDEELSISNISMSALVGYFMQNARECANDQTIYKQSSG